MLIQTIATIYFFLYLLFIFIEPFFFGESRGTYSAKSWIVKVVIMLPLMWLLAEIAFS